MANVKITINGPLMDGHKVTFKAPCDCTAIEYLDVRYVDGNTQASKLFTMKDAHGITLAGIGNLFATGAYVHAILDTKNGFAYLQNPNTNGYLEKQFDMLKPSKVASGTDITIGDASGIALAGMKLFGKTTQGENPSPYNPQELESRGEWGNLLGVTTNTNSANGITTNYSYGKCVISGKTTDATIIFILGSYNAVNKIADLDEDETYTISEGVCAYLMDSNGNRLYKSGTFTLPTGYELRGVVYLSEAGTSTTQSGVSVNKTVYVMLNKGSSAKPYRPYTGQKEIETVVRGGNLTPITTTTETNFSLAYYLESGVTYTLSFKQDKAVGGSLRYNTQTGDSVEDTNVSAKTDVVCTFTPTKSGWLFYNGWGTSKKTNIMLNRGDVALPYEPYKEPQTMISKVGTDGLCGIPVIDSSLANHVDENGQMWCCDEIDFERGKKIQRVKERTFSSSDGWDVMTLDDNVSVFYTPVGDMLNASKLLCDKYTSPYHSSSERVGDKRVTANMGTGLYVWVRDDSYNGDLAAFKADLSENPITVQYILATPIETDLTPDEIAQYRNLHTNKPNTIIQNDCDAEMEVEYYTESHDGAFGKVMRELALLREQLATLTTSVADVASAMLE